MSGFGLESADRPVQSAHFTPYSDQIIDPSTGLISHRKLRDAFSQLCTVLGVDSSWTGQEEEEGLRGGQECGGRPSAVAMADGEMSEVSDDDDDDGEEDDPGGSTSISEGVRTTCVPTSDGNAAVVAQAPDNACRNPEDSLYEKASPGEERSTSCGSVTLHPVPTPPDGLGFPDFPDSPLSKGKLALILDLDNTLLHAQAQANLGCDIALSDYLDAGLNPDMFKFDLPCNRKLYYLKFRPHLRFFLDVLSKYYELSIYTNATKEYADLVLSVLDRDGKLFSDRIVARDGKSRGAEFEKKYVARLYPNLDRRLVVAFDDRQDIWMDLPQRQVLKAQHYEFLESSKSELASHYPALSGAAAQPKEGARKPRDLDDHLFHLTKVFLQLHKIFFRRPRESSVGEILESMGKTILSGVGIYFTGFRKTFMPGILAADWEERQIELAQSLGARVYKKYDEPGVTHVVAGKNNTNNLLACKEGNFKHLKKVHTLWLYQCEACWQRAGEEPFDVDKVCMHYENMPPTTPYRDHWIHANWDREDSFHAAEKPASCPAMLPTREFWSSCAASEGAKLYSPVETIILRWRGSGLKSDDETHHVASQGLARPIEWLNNAGSL